MEPGNKQEVDDLVAILGITHVAEFQMTGSLEQKKLKGSKLSRLKVEIKEVEPGEKVMQLPSSFNNTAGKKTQNANIKDFRQNKLKYISDKSLTGRKSVKEEVLENSGSDEMTDGPENVLDDVYGCNICLKTFSSASKLKAHLKTHEVSENADPEETTDESEIVSKDVYKDGHGKGHKAKIKTERSLCNVCSKTFSKTSALKEHMESHQSKEYRQERRAPCNICSKKFLRSRNLKDHMKTHEKPELRQEMQSLCNVCSKTFASKHILKTHMKLHDPESEKYKPDLDHFMAKHYGCDMCPEKLQSKLKLAKHIANTHGNVQQVTCSYCMKFFSYASISKHTKYCKMSEEDKQNLKENNKVKCDDCGKVLRDKTKLNRHIRFIHNKEKLLRCNRCEREYYSKENLKMHVKKCHGEENLEELASKVYSY